MARREKPKGLRDSDAVTIIARERRADRETLRRVRDFIEDEMCRQQCEAPILYGDDILAILNGTERKEIPQTPPAADETACARSRPA